ncbi:MAG TPA: glutaredoxin family protein [Usitatibacter sp.]|nr:glutaredoxin family protein [Usitatibacter sp.]
MRTMQVALVLLSLAAALGYAQSTVYRWTDKDGKIHFTDAPPPDDAKGAVERRMGGGGPDDSNLPYATQQAARRNPVSIFVSPDCGDDCIQARDLLEKRGVPYTERDALNNVADKEELKKLVGALYVPTLAVGSTPLKGYSEEQWNAALDAAGYPRTRLPGGGSMRRNPPAEK